MARNRSPNRDKAWELYRRYKGNIRNKEIAEILGEDPRTIAKWKGLDKWAEKLEKESKGKREKTEQGRPDVESEKEVNAITEFDALNDRQILFCMEYLRCFNATKAYQKVYGANRNIAAASGCRLLKKANIQLAIARLRTNRINQAMLKPEDIFQKYMDIAFSDMREYMDWGTREILTDIEPDGSVKKEKVPFLELRNAEDVDSSLVSEIKETRYGIALKAVSTSDKLRALDWLAAHMNMATEEQRIRMESLKSKIQVEQEKLELQKAAQEASIW